VSVPATEIDGGHAQIDVKVDLFLIARLTVTETSVLLSVPDSQFQLVAQPVVPDDLFGGLLRVAGGQERVLSGRPA